MNADRLPVRRNTLTSPVPPPAVDLHALAVQAGEDWARSFADELHAQGRPAVGGWPGTMSEAMACVRRTIGTHVVATEVSIDLLRGLARAAYGAARTTWQAVSTRDEEP